VVLACGEPINERDFLEKLFDSNAGAERRERSADKNDRLAAGRDRDHFHADRNWQMGENRNPDCVL